MVVLVVVRVWLAVVMWEPGWSALTWDDFTRVQLARQWAAEPQFAPGGDLVWLPGPTWVNGLAFMAVGGGLHTNPMLLTAILNTVAALAAAAVLGWSALRLWDSPTGGLITFAAVLFAPWGVFTSLSGLGEPVYYLAVAGVSAATLAWVRTSSLPSLAAAAGCVGAAAACRYEGWVLAGSWAIVVAFLEWGPPHRWGHRSRPALRRLAVIATAAVVPLVWIGYNLVRTGDPFFFVAETARYFTSAYGTIQGLQARITYYPVALLRAAPLLLTGAIAVIVLHRGRRSVRALGGIIGLQFAILYASSLVSPVVGAFNERFLFAVALALTPLLGGLAVSLPRLTGPRRIVVATVAATAVIGLTAARIGDRPVEWSHAPDLLTLAAVLGDAAGQETPVSVTLGPGLANDVMPLAVRNGDDLAVDFEPGMPLTGPEPAVTWIERLPARIAAIDRTPTATIGRFAVYTDLELEVPTCPGCEGWTLRTETGELRPVLPGPFVPLEFDGDDPIAGQEALVWVEIPRTAESRRAVLELRSLYGHGFNPGRLELLVRVDDTLVLRRDLAEPSRWLTVGIPIDPGTGVVRVEVVVRALPGIETGWMWGRASTVLIRSLVVEAS